ncbi:MAG: MgtC/SapB family protein, partial [Bdellovibrionota bacterium]
RLASSSLASSAIYKSMDNLLPSADHWPHLESLYRLALALGVGLFIGIEREWRGKEAGLRTFGFAALLGGIGGMLGDPYAILCVAMIGLLVIFLNIQSIRSNQGTELTTSAALLVTGMTGVLCGKGHTITPTAISVVIAGFLAWKERLATFSHKLTAEELRSEILLAILAFGVYPVLPKAAIDPWNLIYPQEAFITVIVIASIGLINYILLKLFGPKGMEITAFFGGLVNSRKVIVELTSRLQTMGEAILPAVYRGVMLATVSMLLRNVLIVVLFASSAAIYCLIPFTLMLATSAVLWLRSPQQNIVLNTSEDGAAPLHLESPFRLSAALKFALVFLGLNVAGAVLQRQFGSGSFYLVSVLGGFLSSASSIAAAANLMTKGEIPISTGVTGIIISSLTSILINIPLIRAMTNDVKFKKRAFLSLGAVATMGLVGVVINQFIEQLF